MWTGSGKKSLAASASFFYEWPVPPTDFWTQKKPTFSYRLPILFIWLISPCLLLRAHQRLLFQSSMRIHSPKRMCAGKQPNVHLLQGIHCKLLATLRTRRTHHHSTRHQLSTSLLPMDAHIFSPYFRYHQTTPM